MIRYNEELTQYLLDKSFVYSDFRKMFLSVERKVSLLKFLTRQPISPLMKSRIDQFNSLENGTIIILPFSKNSEDEVVVWINLNPDQIKKYIYLRNFM